jgi:hypothetical protein
MVQAASPRLRQDGRVPHPHDSTIAMRLAFHGRMCERLREDLTAEEAALETAVQDALAAGWTGDRVSAAVGDERDA